MLQTLKKRLKNRKGFTLIELIVVIAIIAILAAVLIPQFAGFTTRANDKAAISSTRTVLTAVNAILAENPTTTLTTLTEANTEIPKMTGKLPSGATFSVASIGDTGVNMTFNVTLGGKAYAIAVENGTIDTTFDSKKLDGTTAGGSSRT